MLQRYIIVLQTGLKKFLQTYLEEIYVHETRVFVDYSIIYIIVEKIISHPCFSSLKAGRTQYNSNTVVIPIWILLYFIDQQADCNIAFERQDIRKDYIAASTIIWVLVKGGHPRYIYMVQKKMMPIANQKSLEIYWDLTRIPVCIASKIISLGVILDVTQEETWKMATLTGNQTYVLTTENLK